MTAIITPAPLDNPTAGMTETEQTAYYRGRKTEQFATAFAGTFYEGDPRDITPEQWFDMADILGNVMPGDETKAAVIATMDVERGKNRLAAPKDTPHPIKRAYYTARKAARIARYLTDAGVIDAREVGPRQWREARIEAGLSQNEAPSDITRAFITGIIDQRSSW